MKKLTLKLKIEHPKEYQYLKDPKSDLFVFIDRQIFPLHINLLAEKSSYFERILITDPQRQHKIHIIEYPLNSETVKLLLSTFYGYHLQLNRGNNLHQIIQTILFFNLTELYEQIVVDLQKNLDQYDFFVAMQLAYKYNLTQILNICQEKLQNQNFDQLDYNLYDLLNCSQDMFMKIMSDYTQHNQCLKTKQNREKQIANLVRNYQSYNKVKLSAIEIKSCRSESTQNSNRKIEIFSIEEKVDEEQVEEEDQHLWMSDKDNSTQPSPKDLLFHNTFEEAGEIFDQFISESEETGNSEKQTKIRCRRNSYYQ